MHAVKTEPARFWRVFGGLLPVLPVSRQKRPEGLSGVLITDVMVNQSHLHCYSEPEETAATRIPAFFPVPARQPDGNFGL